MYPLSLLGDLLSYLAGNSRASYLCFTTRKWKTILLQVLNVLWKNWFTLSASRGHLARGLRTCKPLRSCGNPCLFRSLPEKGAITGARHSVTLTIFYWLAIQLVVCGAAESTWSLLEMQTIRLHLRPAQLEFAFKQDPQVIHMHMKVREGLIYYTFLG